MFKKAINLHIWSCDHDRFCDTCGSGQGPHYQFHSEDCPGSINFKEDITLGDGFL